ncbi:LysR family transcriptional regulator [Rhizobium bangladeshense]|uniref:LysR family transcriptional regulator n=1 Tax=Rhizobium bangladeshense TaxID=1138189 RepID=UPI001A994759|nr:LysR family transcriptional regulator [Rhizobium bangladeshense]MBX4892960.1 LysR family transcriptional regulator [Rhizobium bangladeshense]MBX4917353.1 LysR family transcriptional regulator [Rhizobium bangladeshense]QSY97471.1 LysR family transcriptional regulator [Rhizobium bangladeshense]
MTVSLRQIEAFLAVAAQGTFTKAAELLHVAQPALSQLVRELELTLGVRLLDRTTRRVELTEAGREFQGAAIKIMEDLHVAIDNAGQLAERKRGRIVIAVPPLLAAVMLPPAIQELHNAYPGLKVVIMDARNDIIVDAVRSGQVDCGVGTFSTLEGNIERSALARDELMLFCPPTSRFSSSSSVDWVQLSGEPLITLTRDSGIRLLVDIGFETAQIEMKPAYEVTQITTALALVRAGLGVAVLPTYARAVSDAQILTRRLEPSISRDIVMIRPGGRSMSPALATFEMVLRRHARRLVPEK